MKKNIFGNLLRMLFLTMAMLFVTHHTVAQSNMTKIKDGSVAGTANIPVLGAVLELESSNKGFLTPRLTAGQRDAIAVANRVDGLLIYNTTSGCFNYWSTAQDVWLSLCGTPPPAVMSLSAVQCDEVEAKGIYKQGEFLNANNILLMPVSVSQAGTYDVSASTNNGYYFSATGTFPTTGSYMLTLVGVGTPNIGYNTGEPGDELTIVLNNRLAACKPHVFVEKANVDFSITCANIQAVGDYFIGMALDTNNKLSVQVNVTSTGFWSLNTNTVNGYSFAGTGNFTELGVQTIELNGTGVPVASGTNLFNMSSNSNTPTNCSGITVIVQPVKYTVDCSEAVINGSYMQDVALNATNTITVKVNVQATGSTTLSTNTVSGITFTSGVVNLDAIGEQLITLTGTGRVSGASDIVLALTGTPGLVAGCNITVPIAAQPVNYTMSCSSITVNGNYAPETAMTAANNMTISVTVTYPGAYSLTTETVNGISFSGTGTFTTTGTQTVTLQATGTPVAGGSFTFNISNNSSTGGSDCPRAITFVYRTMNILGLGGSLYSPGSANNSQAARALIQNRNYFGPTGTVQIENMRIVNGGYSQGAALRNLINSNNIDIVVIAHDFGPVPESVNVLTDFVKNKKGVLIQGEEAYTAYMTAMINSITGGNASVTGAGGTFINPSTASQDAILKGPFLDVTGKSFGSDVNNSQYIENLPANMTSLVSQQGNTSRSWMAKHNTLGYVVIGDGGWASGTPSNGSYDIWPALISTTGAAMSKPYGSGGSTVVYNSFLYVNTLAWAVKYAQENTIVTYIVQ